MEQPTRPLSPEKILDVWEAGRQQHELDRALTLLTAASGLSRDELADLTIGERDARLLRLRKLVLGAGAAGISECPECGERVEFAIDTATIATRPANCLTKLWKPSARRCCKLIRSRKLSSR
ncbi:MAG: hypothetical protein DME51_10765 [Verrucomicrobia bacterium]|nr:MAG: hypothetical protein DME51_10765 [Verrucomicrobiota bacterium]